MSTTSGCKELKLGQLEFVTSNQFFCSEVTVCTGLVNLCKYSRKSVN